ncbi:hypothetical protein HPP92_014331 [Vanilla planifolia]|uniref:Uncharacterized protein n=1 Tax=Vanilla planifolia TaxID=51239 RepID=A0A835UYU4_VANPL|nr:hypothetical protein HPP92_014331 [Vanilla planifolia]
MKERCWLYAGDDGKHGWDHRHRSGGAPTGYAVSVAEGPGKLVVVGGSTEDLKVGNWCLIDSRGNEGDAGDAIFAAEHNVRAEVEIIPISYVNNAMERLAKGDVIPFRHRRPSSFTELIRTHPWIEPCAVFLRTKTAGVQPCCWTNEGRSMLDSDAGNELMDNQSRYTLQICLTKVKLILSCGLPAIPKKGKSEMRANRSIPPFTPLNLVSHRGPSATRHSSSSFLELLQPSKFALPNP